MVETSVLILIEALAHNIGEAEQGGGHRREVVIGEQLNGGLDVAYGGDAAGEAVDEGVQLGFGGFARKLCGHVSSPSRCHPLETGARCSSARGRIWSASRSWASRLTC